MKYTSFVLTAFLLSACSILAGLGNSCEENKADGSRVCTMNDSNQNVMTRTIERDHKLFVSTCSNGNCTEFKEIVTSPSTMK